MRKFSLIKFTEWLWYLLLFLLPLQTRKIIHKGFLNGGEWEYGTIGIYGTDILLGILLALVFYLWLKSDKGKIKIRPIWWLIAIFELVAFVSIFWSLDKGVAVYGWIKILIAVAVFWLVINLKFNNTKALVALVLGAVVQSLFAVQQLIMGRVLDFKWIGMFAKDPAAAGVSVVEIAAERFLRAYGTQVSPNILGGILVIAFFAILLLYLKSDQRYQKLFSLASLVLIIVGIVLSFSRASWLALAIGIVSYFVIGHFHKSLNLRRALEFFSAFLLVLVLCVMVFWQPIITRIKSDDRLEVKSTVQRLTYENEASILIQKYQPLGVGINNYTVGIYKDIDSSFDSWAYQPVHNVWLLITAELGWLGIVAAACILSFFVIMISRRSFVIINNQFFTIFSVQLIVLFILLWFDHWLWSSHLGLLFAGLTTAFLIRSTKRGS